MTPTIKAKVAELWDKFWSGGISNPLNAIEQITYLLFIKQIDRHDTEQKRNAEYLETTYESIFEGEFLLPGAKEGIPKEELRWSIFLGKPADQMYNIVQTQVFPFIKQLGGENSFFTKHMQNAALMIPSPRMLTEAIKTIEAIYVELDKEKRFVDAQGDLYEYLLGELSTAGKMGQFRTPTHIIELIVELVNPQLGHKIADPACGTAGFLLGAYKYIQTQFTSEAEKHIDENGFLRGSLADLLVDDNMKTLLAEETFYGFDIDPTMIRIGLMNLMMHGITQPKIDYADTLSKNYNEDNIYDIVLANPPFTGSIDKGFLNESFTVSTTKSELLFVERIYKMLRIGGTAGVVVPQGVLFGSSKAFKDLRKILIENSELRAVITMPSGVFKPYAGVATAILVFTKGGETKDVWFYDMLSDGKSLDDKRSDLFNPDGSRNYGDLHNIIAEFKKAEKNRNRTLQHFLIPKKEIVDNDYDLSINKYKDEEYEEVEYEHSAIILEKLENLENNIQDKLKQLKEALHGI
ncbi:MAG: type I restriction-modification system subunit M [Bacteroides intestinalis]|nr:type I restriction-modification system subunit M [Bacteroides intestinalis]MCD7978383.1 type I restriction-modification system subunit M [Tannerellaceae bacterium]